VAEKRYGVPNSKDQFERSYVVTEIEVDLCQGCSPPFWDQIGENVMAMCGADVAHRYRIAWTNEQYAELVTCAPVAAVASAPDKVQNANLQLTNMRDNAIKTKDGTVMDPVYRFGIHIVWPYVAALLTSGQANKTSSLVCCASRAVTNQGFRRCRLRKVQHIKLLPAGDAGLEPIKKEIPALGLTLTKDRLREVIVALNPKDGPDELKKKVEKFWSGEEPEPARPGDRPVEKCLGHQYIYDAGADEHKSMTEDDILAVKYGPTTVDKAFFANTPANIHEAVEERINKKQTSLEMTTEERDELQAITQQFIEEMRGVDNKEAGTFLGGREANLIKNIATSVLFEDIAPKKWSPARTEQALQNLMMKYNPKYEFKCSVKLEPMPAGKPPRMIIADQDAGAVMSALIIGVLERYICKRRGKQTIKGKAKDVRMMEICEETQKPVGGAHKHPAFLLENDGSAWDTCCKDVLRALTENLIMDYLFDQLSFLITPYSHFNAPRKAANEAKKLTLQMGANKLKVELWTKLPDKWFDQSEIYLSIFKKNVKIQIEAIRRSGDKGTSILNWIINMISWFWVLCGKRGAEFFRENAKVLIDIFGEKRHFHIWCEGDDSLLWLTNYAFTFVQGDELERRWKQLGHRPKLFLRTDGDEAEFCGWKMVVDKYGLVPRSAMPDVPRLLQNCFYTTAREAIDAAKSGDELRFARLVAPAVVARASSIAERAPSIASWLLRYVAELGDGKLRAECFTADDIYRMGRDDLMQDLLPERWKGDDQQKLLDSVRKYGDFIDNVQEAISNSIASGGLAREAELAVEHKWVQTEREWTEIVTKLGLVVPGVKESLFREIFPRWRDSAGALQGICK